MNNASKRGLWRAASVGLTVVAVIWLAFNVNWIAVVETVTRADTASLLAAFFVFVVNYLLRTLRFRMLTKAEKIPLMKLTGVTCLYGMYNYLLPARLGEATFVVLARSRLDLPVVAGTSVLLATRYFDFASVALFLPAALVLMGDRLEPWILVPSLVFIALFTLLSAGLYLFFTRRIALAEPNLNRVPTLLARGLSWLGKLATSIKQTAQTSNLWRMLLVTAAIWLCVYGNFYLIIRSLGFQPTLSLVVVLSVIMIPLTLLPVQGFANVGSHEVGWVAGLTLFGWSSDVALEIAIGAHVLLLAFVVALGLFGMALIGDPRSVLRCGSLRA